MFSFAKPPVLAEANGPQEEVAEVEVCRAVMGVKLAEAESGVVQLQGELLQ